MRIVIYRAGALGDTLLTFPALRVLLRQWRDAHITLICRSDVHALARASDLADRTYSHELSAWACLFDAMAEVSGLARETFAGADLALVWAPDSGGVIASHLRTLGVLTALIAQPPPLGGSRRHVALQLMDALAPLGIDSAEDLAELAALLPVLRWPQPAQDEADVMWERLRAELAGRLPVALHPGSGGARKVWPPSHVATLIHELRRGFAPILVAGPQDDEVVAQVIAEGGATPVVRDMSVAGVAAFLSACATYIGNDSGVTHLAGMLGVPTIALFGPTEPAHWAPIGQHAVTLRSSSGRMRDLLPESAIETIRRIMGWS
jgi:ADP-heptose:LPS heptosyltransferase